MEKAVDAFVAFLLWAIATMYLSSLVLVEYRDASMNYTLVSLPHAAAAAKIVVTRMIENRLSISEGYLRYIERYLNTHLFENTTIHAVVNCVLYRRIVNLTDTREERVVLKNTSVSGKSVYVEVVTHRVVYNSRLYNAIITIYVYEVTEPYAR